jgi:hypothetical protein
VNFTYAPDEASGTTCDLDVAAVAAAVDEKSITTKQSLARPGKPSTYFYVSK